MCPTLKTTEDGSLLLKCFKMSLHEKEVSTLSTDKDQILLGLKKVNMFPFLINFTSADDEAFRNVDSNGRPRCLFG